MRKQTLLQRLVAGLAANKGVQPKRTEICRGFLLAFAPEGMMKQKKVGSIETEVRSKKD